MSILKKVEESGAQFYSRSGKSINGQGYWAIIVQHSTVISIDDFHPEGFEALHQALFLKEARNSKRAFLAVDGMVRNIDIYLVDLLPKSEYDINIIKALTNARDQMTFFDVESGEEILSQIKTN